MTLMAFLGIGIKKSLGAALIAAVVLPAAGYIWLFREYSEEDKFFGTVTCKFKWGHAHSMEFDSDRDGRVNFLMLMDPGGAWFNDCNMLPLGEMWFDTDQDGRFEARGIFELKGKRRVEIDTDHDGRSERILEGKEATAFLDARMLKVKKN